jgi:hypothetical protein
MVGSQEGDEGECRPDAGTGESGGGGTGRNWATGCRGRSGDSEEA